MSTRCQVYVYASGLPWDAEAITLYHHSDGYPGHMLACIESGFKLATDSQSWRAGRPGKAASFLCTADPGAFEPESGHELHGDIEYFYDVECVNSANGSMAETPQWRVKVFRANEKFRHTPSKENLTPSIRRIFK